MAAFLLRRLAASALLLFLLLTLVFFLIQLVPGDPGAVLLDARVPPAQAERMRAVYRLDRPVGEQYVAWLSALALRGEWGVSFAQNRPVAAMLLEALPYTLVLAAAALVVQYVVGIALGVAAARRAGGLSDHLLRVVALGLYAMPVFWSGLMAILLFSLVWPIFPTGGARGLGAVAQPAAARALDLLQHLALPAMVLGLGGAGGTSRFARNAVLEVLGQDYIRCARAKGLTERRVLWVHALRNGAGPLTQLLGLALPFLLSGSLVVEVVFSWPGMGRVAYQAIGERDYPVILAATALTGGMVVLGSLLADVLHAALDPRVREAL